MGNTDVEGGQWGSFSEQGLGDKSIRMKFIRSV